MHTGWSPETFEVVGLREDKDAKGLCGRVKKARVKDALQLPATRYKTAQTDQY